MIYGLLKDVIIDLTIHQQPGFDKKIVDTVFNQLNIPADLIAIVQQIAGEELIYLLIATPL